MKLSVIGQALNGGVSFFGVALWARNSSSSDLATIFITLSIMAVLVDLFDFGGSAWATRELVYSKLNSNIVWNFLFKKIRILIVLLLIISIIFLYRGAYPVFVFFVATYPFYILCIGYFQGFCLTQDKYFQSFFAQFLERIFWIFPIGLLEFVTDPLICIEISLIIGSSLSVMYMLGLASRYSRQRNSQAHLQYNFLDTYKLSKKLGFGSVISDLYSLDTFLVQNFSNSIQAGGYSLIQKNRNFAVLGFAVFGSKLRLAVSESKKSSRKLFKDDWHILILNIMVLILVFIFAPE